MDSVVDSLRKKADRTEVSKEVERLERMIENLTQLTSDLGDKQNTLEKEFERLSQYIEVSQKTIL